MGWYEGYATHFVASMAYGGTITRGVSESTGLSNRLDTARAGLDDVTPTLRAGQGSQTAQISQRVVSDGGNPQIDTPTVMRGLQERGFSPGKQDIALTRLDEIPNSHLEALSSSDQTALAARLANSADGDATVRFVSDITDPNDVQQVLNENLATTNRLSELYDNRNLDTGQSGNLQYRHLDIDEASDLVRITQQTDIADVQLITKRDGEVRWLENGNLDYGWEHISARHIDGNYGMDTEGGTSMFPTGQQVNGESLPGTMSREDIKDLTFESIKNGDVTMQGQRTKYYYQPTQSGYPNTGVDEMRVHVRSDGSVLTTYPLSGDDVQRWVPELNDGQGGWVDTT
ncbi:hypothetical protein G6M89_20190 [Natronolimnobius sp. AArcel1]|uniref:hypothetical protein n=1 Tax=Natronolimnobius sp. AArcel1 TaxID=1679093 RepID=UPI0013ECC4B8|nr:hypothetical protein [Natronolimnobius sp. AArcel1]NGM71290.1 hypothetical protein [Natronolimnobius sp. AArcel1]